MSLVPPYPHEDRNKARLLIKRMEKTRDLAQDIMRGLRPFSPDFSAGLTALTDTADPEQQVNALSALIEARRKDHIDHLINLAPDDLTAFAECMSPHEPPAKHHIFVSDRLMEIERGDRDRFMLSLPPGHAKDLCVETPVLMGDGAWKRLGDVEVGDCVITMHGRPREVLAVHEQGVRPVLKITTASGRVVRAHPDHLFLTPNSWVAAKELLVKSVLALPRGFEIAPQPQIYERDHFALVGYMMARAIVTGRTYSRLHRITTAFRCDDAAILADMKAICARLGIGTKQRRQQNFGREAVLLELDDKGRDLLEEMGLFRVDKDVVRVPDFVFTGSEDCIGAFLGAVVSCDGSCIPRINVQSGRQRRVRLTIKRNAGLATDLTRLLLRLGVKASTRVSLQRCYNYGYTEFHPVDIDDSYDQMLLAKRLRLIGGCRRFWDLPIVTGQFHNAVFHGDPIVSIETDGETQTRCLTVEEDHSFLAEGLVVHNSTYGSRYYPAWYLGRKEHRIYLQAGHSKDFAEKEFGRKTKDLIVTDMYRRIFPGVTVRSDAKASGDWILTNGNRYVAKGVGEGISGFRSTNNSVDDPYKDYASAQSPAMRKKTWEWFANDFMTRLLPQGNAFIISTRWHVDDLIGHLEDMIAAGDLKDHWEIINLPALCLDEENDPIGRKIFEPLWPEFYTLEVLNRQKALMSDSEWSCLYDGNPLPLEGSIIKKEWIGIRYQTFPNQKGAGPLDLDTAPEVAGDPKHFNTGGDPTEFKGGGMFRRTVVSVDSAEKDTQRADFTAITVWREGMDRYHYLIDAQRERMEFPRLVEAVNEMATRWGAEYVLMEEKGAGNQYIQHMAAEAVEGRTTGFVVVGINPGRDGKIFRMDAVTPFFKSKRVVLPARAPWLAHLERELLQFPAGKHDDYPDSISQYLKWARDTSTSRRGSRKLKGHGLGRRRT